MNAVERMAPHLSSDAVRRLAALRVQRFDRTRVPARAAATNEEAVTTVIARWGNDLCALLNVMTRDELADLATSMRVSTASRDAHGTRGARHAFGANDSAHTINETKARADELRVAMWELGAEIERDGVSVSTMIQPRPIVLGGHLVVQAPPRGIAPMATAYPRIVPASRPWTPRVDEPDSIDELLDAATDAIGVRLGARGRDKGAWGVRAAQLLGVVERGLDEPDWRGDVEIKTVPVAREPNGYWNVVEDPAIAMVGERGIAKLQRTLWLARATIAPDNHRTRRPGREDRVDREDREDRVDRAGREDREDREDRVNREDRAGREDREDRAGREDREDRVARVDRVDREDRENHERRERHEREVEDATIVSWYLLEWDAHVARLAKRYLHERPKGPRGTTQKGLYLHKRFFVDAGMLATLNGVA
ncbi:MAG: hypothetical protein ACKV2T_43875 [Kofleriaceae bacterium]